MCIPSAPRTSNHLVGIHVNGVAKSWSDISEDDSSPGGAAHKRYIEDLKFARSGDKLELLGRVLVILATYDSYRLDDQGRKHLAGSDIIGSVTFRCRDRETLVLDGIAPPAVSSDQGPSDTVALVEEVDKINRQITGINAVLRTLSDRRFYLVQKLSSEATQALRSAVSLQSESLRRHMAEGHKTEVGEGAGPSKRRKKTHGAQA